MAERRTWRRLVGRDPALAALRARVDDAANGHGGLVLVAGEPGVGKTAVLAATAAAADDGVLVMWAQCWAGDGAPAFWPWVQVLRAGIAAGGDAGDAALLLPAPTAVAAPAGGAEQARFRMFDGAVRFLARLATQRPVLVVLDDLHWADDDSLRLLEFAARHVTAEAVLLLGAYRDEEAGAALRALAAGHERIILAGLPRAGVAALMAQLTGADPPPPAATQVWRRTGGNPFLVRELTRLIQAGAGSPDAPSPELRAAVGDILGRRLARLSPSCVDLLTVAAVAGPQVRPEVLARVTGDADATDGTGGTAALLAEALEARVLADDTPPGTYRFSHDLFRETLLAGIPRRRRTVLHLEIARALAALAGRGVAVHPSELASHFDAAAAEAPAEAVRHHVLAGEDATTRLAFEEARTHHERALVAAGLTPTAGPGQRLTLLLQLGDARDRAGDIAAARQAYADAAALARGLDDAAGLARAALGTHAVGWRYLHARGVALLEEAAGVLPAQPTPLRARVLAALARDLHHGRDGRDRDRAPALAEQAVAIARSAGDPGTLAFALLALHDARWRPGSARARLPVVDEMLSAGIAVGDGDLVAQARLLRATALIELGEPEGLAELDAYCRHGDELGHARARYGATSRRATAALIAGDLAGARAFAADALRLGTAIGEPDAHGVHATLLWGVARAGGAGPRLADGMVAPEADPSPGTPLLEALDQITQGDLDAARRTLARLRIDRLPRAHDLELLALAAEAVVPAGSDRQREQVYELLRPHAGTHVVVGGCASYFGAVDHLLGLLARALGRADRAHGHFADAAALHQRLGARLLARRSRQEADACQAHTGAQACVFRRDGDVWTISYRGAPVHLPDRKGLRDLAVLLAAPGRAVHAVELHTGRPPHTGADAMLDDRAKAAYRRRLAELDADLDDAAAAHDPHRAERARVEREALLAELSAAVGLGGRDRRLGDDRERARKAVGARIRDAIDRIDRNDPDLGRHLRATVRTGTWCCYEPTEPVRWRT